MISTLSITIRRCGPETFCFLLIAVPRLDEVSLWVPFTKAGRKLRILFKLNSSLNPLLKNLCLVSDVCMHSPQPYYLYRDPCTALLPTCTKPRNPGHTEVKLHLCLGWMPQWEDELSCPPNGPCLSPFPRTTT